LSGYYSEPGDDVQNRRQDIGRILGDPTLFPDDFRAWLKRFIEQAGITIPYTSISGKPGGADVSFTGVLPPGVMLPYAASAISNQGALLCNGQEVSRETYSILFGVIGTNYGAGNGTTTFNVPDCRDRSLYGSGSLVGIAANEGGALGQRGPRHHHTFSGNTGGGGAHGHSGDTGPSGDHRHDTEDSSNFAVMNGTTYTVNSSSGSQRYLITGQSLFTAWGGNHTHGLNINGVGDHTHGFSGGTSGGGVQDAPGYLGVLYVIITGL
jgi:microcystin-dependent protein